MAASRVGRWALVVAVFCLALPSPAQELWLGLFLQGKKIGYTRTTSLPDTQDGVAGTATRSLTIVSAGLLGTSLDLRMDSSSFADAAGKPKTMVFKLESAGRTQTVLAKFFPTHVECVSTAGGDAATKRLELPAGATVVDDPLIPLLEAGVVPGSTDTFYVLDPLTVSLQKNTLKVMPKESKTVEGLVVEAYPVVITDPRATTTAYFTAKGDFLYADAPMGMRIRPLTREQALATEDDTRIDLAAATSIPVPSAPPPSAEGTQRYRVKSDKLPLPSGGHQTVRPVEGGLEVEVHPAQFGSAPGSAQSDARWLQPGLHVPCGTAPFPELAQEVAGNGDLETKANRVAKWVYETMRPNAGIGVLRDASEVLSSREGVCRDYAVLTATLLRAAQVPTRLCSGLILMDERLYYHAWVEVFDRGRWIGVDSTRPRGRVTTGHIKLAEGTVEEAFTFPVLDGVQVEAIHGQ